MKRLYINDLKNRAKNKKKEQKKLCLNYILNKQNVDILTKIKLKNKIKKLKHYTKVRNRCSITFRARGIIKSWKVSRIFLRKAAGLGLVPNLKKSIW